MSRLLGSVRAADGKRGPWSISTFTLDRRDAALHNIKNARSPGMWIREGTYKRLVHEKRGVVMSNTPMEIRTNIEGALHATGRVHINGLGLGMLLDAVLSKPDVTFVRVVEIDKDVIALVGPNYEEEQRSGRLEIVHADAYEYAPPKGERYDYVWHDIWDDICEGNLPLMAKLTRRYRKPIAAKQGVWSRAYVRADARRY